METRSKILNELLYAIYNNYWIEIKYNNKENVTKSFWIAIKKIVFEKEAFICDSLSLENNKNEIKEINIFLSGILSIKRIDNTFYSKGDEVIKQINENADEVQKMFKFYDYNSVLCYLEECIKEDTEPFKAENDLLLGVDMDVLEKALRDNQEYHLSKEQCNTLKKHMSNKDKSINQYKSIGMNVLSIEYSKKKKYVVAYKPVKWNVEKQSMVLINKIMYNNKFKDHKDSNNPYDIGNYLHEDEMYMLDNYEYYYKEIYETISKRIPDECQLVDRSDIVFFEKIAPVDLSREFNSIRYMFQTETVSEPIKAFFGEISEKPKRRKFYPLCLVNNELNEYQIFSIFTGLKDDVSFIQGPPGTGKTSTVVNIVTTAFYNDLKTIIVTNNNQPMKDLKAKFDSVGYYKDKTIELPICRLSAKDKMIDSIISMNHLYNKYKDASVNETILTKNKEYQNSNRNELNQELNKFDEFSLRERRKRYAENFAKINAEDNARLSILLQLNDDSEKVTFDFEKLKKQYYMDEKIVQSFLYFYSAKHIQKLDKKPYKELKDIIDIDISNKAYLEASVEKFIKYIGEDDNVKLLLDVFPIVISTNISANKIGDPKPYFDLCIMDEAAQCNIATSLIPIIRAKKLILVGDIQQLRPVILLPKSINDELLEKYNINENYNYLTNSIYSCMQQSAPTCRENLLTNHYRCNKKIIKFCNDKYYNKRLNVCSKSDNDDALIFVNTEKEKTSIQKNVTLDDVKKTIELLSNDEFKGKSIGIITPYVSQKNILEQELKLNFDKKIVDYDVGTIHTFQGNEKDVIVFSSSINSTTRTGTYNWLKSNKQLINVAVSRAKEKFIFLGNEATINELHYKTTSNDANENSDKDDIFDLYRFIQKNGNYQVVENTIKSEALGTEEEGNFKDVSRFKDLSLALSVLGSKAKYKEKVKMNEVIPTLSSNTTFDFVIYDNHITVIQLIKSIKRNVDTSFIENECRKNNIKYIKINPEELRSYFALKDFIKEKIM